MNDRLCVYLSSEAFDAVSRLSTRKGVTKSAVVEAAILSFVSPDHSDQREAAFSRRLDRLTRQIERLDRNQAISAEAIALFIRFWLSATPPIPPEALASAQAKGRERYQNFIETLAQRLQQGKSLAREIPEDLFMSARAGRVDEDAA